MGFSKNQFLLLEMLFIISLITLFFFILRNQNKAPVTPGQATIEPLIYESTALFPSPLDGNINSGIIPILPEYNTFDLVLITGGGRGGNGNSTTSGGGGGGGTFARYFFVITGESNKFFEISSERTGNDSKNGYSLTVRLENFNNNEEILFTIPGGLKGSDNGGSGGSGAPAADNTFLLVASYKGGDGYQGLSGGSGGLGLGGNGGDAGKGKMQGFDGFGNDGADGLGTNIINFGPNSNLSSQYGGGGAGGFIGEGFPPPAGIEGGFFYWKVTLSFVELTT
jgi:hypothetical protein